MYRIEDLYRKDIQRDIEIENRDFKGLYFKLFKECGVKISHIKDEDAPYMGRYLSNNAEIKMNISNIIKGKKAFGIGIYATMFEVLVHELAHHFHNKEGMTVANSGRQRVELMAYSCTHIVLEKLSIKDRFSLSRAQKHSVYLRVKDDLVLNQVVNEILYILGVV